MTEERKKVKVTVKDKRHTAVADLEPKPDAEAPALEEFDYLGDLQRVQAEFANYRKRTMKEQADTAKRATAKLVERLLPVLDNFELAIAHGEGGEGVALVYRELKTALEATGLEEVPAKGQPFDPTVHEAIMSKQDESISEETVIEVHRTGYRLGDQLLRPATVVVARPPESAEPAEEVAEA